MLETIQNMIAAIAAFLKIKAKDQELKNTPEMQANARAIQNAEVRDSAIRAVASDDIDEIRRRASE